MKNARATFRLTGLAALLLAISGCSKTTTLGPNTEDYATARTHFQTKLIKHEPAPQDGTTLRPPTDALQVNYSKEPSLNAWISTPSSSGLRIPAVLFLHGGFAVSEEDWEMTKPYRDAGFSVMMPVLRGENKQPGEYSMFYNEVNDVLAAADYLAKLPYVDSKRLFLAGHSVGGTLTLLTAMTSTKFRAAASFSGSPDQKAWSQGQPEVIPFDPSDNQEFEMRSPLAFPTSFKCPVRLYYGDTEQWCASPSQDLATQAKAAKQDVEAIAIPGNHFTEVPAAMLKSISFFQSK